MGTQFLRFLPATLLREEASARTQLPLGKHVMGTWSCACSGHTGSQSREESRAQAPRHTSRLQGVCMGVVFVWVFAHVAYVCCAVCMCVVCVNCVWCVCVSITCILFVCVCTNICCVCVCLHVKHMYVVCACVLCVNCVWCVLVYHVCVCVHRYLLCMCMFACEAHVCCVCMRVVCVNCVWCVCVYCVFACAQIFSSSSTGKQTCFTLCREGSPL